MSLENLIADLSEKIMELKKENELLKKNEQWKKINQDLVSTYSQRAMRTPKKFIVRYTTETMPEIMAVHETKAYSEEDAIQKTRDIIWDETIKILKVETIYEMLR